MCPIRYSCSNRNFLSITLASVFLDACIVLSVSHLIDIYDPLKILSRLESRKFFGILIAVDVLTVVLEMSGGTLSEIVQNLYYVAGKGNHSTTVQWNAIGQNVLLAGLILHALVLLLFAALSMEFIWRVKRSNAPRPDRWMVGFDNVPTPMRAFVFGEKFTSDYRNQRLTTVLALGIATFSLMARAGYRIASLNGGFQNVLGKNETIFMVLEGGMIICAVVVLTFYHPGRVLGDNWRLRDAAAGRAMSAQKEFMYESYKLTDQRDTSHYG